MSDEPMPELELDGDARRVNQLSREILHDSYRSFSIDRLELVENAGVTVKMHLKRSPEGDVQELVGVGVGLIDAVFDGVMKAYAAEYPSLKTVVVSDFKLGSGFDAAKGRRSDALAVATLTMKNSHDNQFTFERKTPSVTNSSVRVALDALTFFINAERAYVQLQLAMKDATERRRSDLVQRYRQQMGTLVYATSYEMHREGE
jgi:hypothetical protein